MFSILLATAALNPEGLDQELPKPQEVVEETHQHDTQEHIRFLNKVYRLAIDGNHQEARSLLERSINASPDFLEARKLLALILLWEDQPASALVQLDYVLEKRPRDIDAILLKGDALTELGRCGEAIDYYTQAEDLGDSFKAQMGIAFCYAKSGEPIRALDKVRSIRAENVQQHLADDLAGL